jgi:peroxiredoxin/tetratricopeptide (TPR) repeat protein
MRVSQEIHIEPHPTVPEAKPRRLGLGATILLVLACAAAAQQPGAPKTDGLATIRSLLNLGKFDEAIAALGDSIKAEPARSDLCELLGLAYLAKWRLELRAADFESKLPGIRSEIDSLLKRKEPAAQRMIALQTASAGYAILSDDKAQKIVDESILAEFPSSNAARGISLGRILDEDDKPRQAGMIERFVSRFPDSADWTLLAMLFRARASDPATSAERLIEIGQSWMRSSGQNSYQATDACVALTVVLAERRVGLDRAQVLADECVKSVDALSPAHDTPAPPAQMNLASLLREWAHAARGFVLLRRGDVANAKKEMDVANGPLQPIKNEVEKNGFILWQDLNWRELGVRPRVLWLAELYEASGEYERAAKYLLAGCYNEDERARQYVSQSLPAVYQKLGRNADQAARDIAAARQRFVELTSASRPGEAEKKALLADRIGRPAPDFQLSTLDKKTVRLADLKGKVVVVNFWATWCGPCVAELPQLQKSYDAHKSNPRVVFIAVSVDENRAAVRPFVERNGLKMVVAYDDGAAGRYQLDGVPATFIIDRDGVIQFRETGFGGSSEEYQDRMRWRIDELLKEQGRQ